MVVFPLRHDLRRSREEKLCSQSTLSPYSFFDRQIDLLTYRPKLCVNLMIAESDHMQAKAFNHPISFLILFRSFLCKMLRTIHFNHELCRMTIKVDYIILNNALLVYFGRIMTQEKIPKFSFVRSHIPA